MAKFDNDVYKNDINKFAYPRCVTLAESNVDCELNAIKTEEDLY
jgi:hypothetical protein